MGVVTLCPVNERTCAWRCVGVGTVRASPSYVHRGGASSCLIVVRFATIRPTARALRLLMWPVPERGGRSDLVGRRRGCLIREGGRGGSLGFVVGSEDAQGPDVSGKSCPQ